MTDLVPPADAWRDAHLAAGLLAIDPGLGGAVVRARPGPAREAWLDTLHDVFGDVRSRRIPAGVEDEALLGGLDLTATLASGRSVRRAGLLETIAGGIGTLPMAERIEAGVAARLCQALDGEDAPVLIALDEGDAGGEDGREEEEAVPEALVDRLAFALDLSGVRLSDLNRRFPALDRESVAMAQVRLPYVETGDAVRALTEAALALGAMSMRTPVMAVRVACANAALNGQDEVSEADIALAARLVLAPRATRWPGAEETQETQSEREPDRDPADDGADSRSEDEDPSDEAEPEISADALTQISIDAAAAALPPGLLLARQEGRALGPARRAGRSKAVRKMALRGRPAGTRRGEPTGGARLDVRETIMAAAPFQRMRRRGAERYGVRGPLRIHKEDLRVRRFKHVPETATIFAVDASGSLALNRLAEAKGAVELMLGESYVRRDQVGLIAFRGEGAEALLAPTRSLTRAKRSLSALPGGGGTPLASAIDAAEAMARQAQRQGRSATLVFLTDGAANVARDGSPGRERAGAQALEAAKRVRAAGHAALIVDVSRRGADAARTLAQTMDARYVRLPAARPDALARLAREAAA